MLKLYDPWENIFQSLQDKGRDPELLYYASDIEQSMGFTDEDMEAAIERAFQACSTMHITIEDHFKPIYRTDNSHELLNDWKLSSLACYLLIINANPANSNVAKVQLFFASKNFSGYHF